MQLLEGEIVLSATDLTGFLECEHLTQLELKAAKGLLVRPIRDDPELDILTRRGGEHEQAHLARLRGEGRSVVEISSESRTRGNLYAREAETVAAVRAGADVIYQATFFDGRWRGHADFLLRVELPSDLGSWSYEVADTKLARKVKSAALLQMSSYSEQLSRIQGTYPQRMHVVLGTGMTESFAVNDFAAYYRAVKARYEDAVTAPERETYPDSVEHCGVCRWRDVCVARRRADDHLSLVAGMRRDVTRRLVDAGIPTMAALAKMAPDTEVDRVGGAVLDKLRQQAQLQVRQRESGRVSYELLAPVSGLGLGLLPEPSPGDLFFDMEGDPFAGEQGLEYLFGVVEVGEGKSLFRSWWATTLPRRRLHSRASSTSSWREFRFSPTFTSTTTPPTSLAA